MRTKVFSILTLFILSITSSASYAGSCYSMQEVEAEQGIRIQSELMVIRLSCQHIAKRQSKDLFKSYANFYSKNRETLASYESTMMKHFEGNEISDPDRALRTLRTEVANRISKDAATMRPDLFCAHYAPRIEKAEAMSKKDFRKWASTIFESHPVSKPVCASLN